MLFVFPILVPANTPQSAKKKTTLQLTAGTITRVMLQFPAGALGLDHISLNNGLNQVWPANPDATFQTSDEVITWLEEYVLDTAPYTLDAYTWNDDDTYDHTITVRLELTPAAAQSGLLDQVKSLLGMGGG